jgi:hypothetical protein
MGGNARLREEVRPLASADDIVRIQLDQNHYLQYYLDNLQYYGIL